MGWLRRGVLVPARLCVCVFHVLQHRCVLRSACLSLTRRRSLVTKSCRHFVRLAGPRAVHHHQVRRRVPACPPARHGAVLVTPPVAVAPLSLSLSLSISLSTVVPHQVQGRVPQEPQSRHSLHLVTVLAPCGGLAHQQTVNVKCDTTTQVQRETVGGQGCQDRFCPVCNSCEPVKRSPILLCVATKACKQLREQLRCWWLQPSHR